MKVVFTPITPQVRQQYVNGFSSPTYFAPAAVRRAHFDRWLEQLEAEIKAETRAAIAEEIRAVANHGTLRELAMRHQGFYSGQEFGLIRAANIAEGDQK